MRYDNPYMTKEAAGSYTNSDIRGELKNPNLSAKERARLMSMYDPTKGIKERNPNAVIKQDTVPTKPVSTAKTFFTDGDVWKSTFHDTANNVADQLEFLGRRWGIGDKSVASAPTKYIRNLVDKPENYIQSDYTGNNTYDKLTGRFVRNVGNVIPDTARAVDGIKGMWHAFVTKDGKALKDLQGKQLDAEYHRRKWDTHARPFDSTAANVAADIVTDPMTLTLMGPGILRGAVSLAGKTGAKLAGKAAVDVATNAAANTAKQVANPTFLERVGRGTLNGAKWLGTESLKLSPFLVSQAGSDIINPIDEATGTSVTGALADNIANLVAVSNLDPAGYSPEDQQAIAEAKQQVASLNERGYYTGNALAAPVNATGPAMPVTPTEEEQPADNAAPNTTASATEAAPVSTETTGAVESTSPAGAEPSNSATPPNTGTPDKPWYDKYDTNWKNWFGNVKFDDPDTWIPRLLTSLLMMSVVGGFSGNGWAAMGAAPLGWGLGGAIQSNWDNINKDLGALANN